jgi:hypothetical protein
MASVSCTFKSIVGGNCSYDPRDRHKKEFVIPLSSCDLDISGHKKAFGVQDIYSEVELILARALMFAVPARCYRADNVSKSSFFAWYRLAQKFPPMSSSSGAVKS